MCALRPQITTDRGLIVPFDTLQKSAQRGSQKKRTSLFLPIFISIPENFRAGKIRFFVWKYCHYSTCFWKIWRLLLLKKGSVSFGQGPNITAWILPGGPIIRSLILAVLRALYLILRFFFKIINVEFFKNAIMKIVQNKIACKIILLKKVISFEFPKVYHNKIAL